jgi:hypothetical protein
MDTIVVRCVPAYSGRRSESVLPRGILPRSGVRDRFTDKLAPWMCSEAVIRLEQIVTSARVFEYGSGTSTLWLCNRAHEVVTVEHSPRWAWQVCRGAVGAHNLLIVLQRDLERYPHEIEQRGEFDVVIVDGRERVRCIEIAREHVVPEGWLVLDDSERQGYRDGIALLADWPVTVVEGRKAGSKPGQIVHTQTTFYRRPD